MNESTDILKIELDITGMTCAACSSRIEKVVNKMDGIENATVNLTTETAKISYLAYSISQDDIITKIEKLGFGASYKQTHAEKKAEKEKELASKRNTVLISALLCIPLLVTMITHLPFVNQKNIPEILMNPYFQFVFATPIQFYIGAIFYKSAFFSLRNKSANMDVLVVLGTSAAYFYSLYQTVIWEGHIYGAEISTNKFYYETSGVLITLILLGKFLEARAKYRTSEAIEHLISLQAKSATILINGEFHTIPLEKVKKEAICIVKPGEKIPLDGMIIDGISTIDESMLTGESIPNTKSKNQMVYGGTLNGSGALQIKVIHTNEDSVLSQIIKTVEEAQNSKAPIQRIADKISGIFVPIVMTIALITFFVWFFILTNGDFSHSLEIAISVLVIACPCALGLATPTSIMVASGKGAEHGILYKGGEYIEYASQVDCIVFDKTGTITKGKPVVTNTKFYKQNALSLLYSIEKQSEHPLASAIVSYAEEKEVPLQQVQNIHAEAGKGMSAKKDNEFIFIGTKTYLLDNQINLPTDISVWEDWEKEGKTVIGIGCNNLLIGIVAVQDEVKAEAKDVISNLLKQGKELFLVTGDNKTTAQAIAKKIGIPNVLAGVLPNEKAEFIKKLQTEGKKVCMIGDGINDAPALASADIGIAMGTGTDIAVETADITLLAGNLSLLPNVFTLSKHTMKNIRQNLFWAFFYNIIGIPIAACGLLAPWIAGGAMALSSVSVVSNALRLKNIKLGDQ